MKKNSTFRLLLLTLSICTFIGANAQTSIFFQNFEASKTVAPAGWTQQITASAPTNKGWEFNNNFPTSGSAVLGYYTPPHTYYAFVDDYDYNNTYVANNDTLYTPSFNCTGQNHVFVSYDAMFVINNGYEFASVAASIDGGKTWTTVDTVPYNFNVVWQDSVVFNISAVAANQANVMLAFTYFDGEPNGYGQYDQGFGMAVDNVDVFAPLSYDLGVTSQNLPYMMKVGTAYTLTGNIFNYGGDSIAAMTMNYSVNGGAVQTDNITGITGFNGLTYYSFSHNVPFTPSVAGIYTIKYWADNLNGSYIDQFHANDTLTTNFLVIDSVQPRQALYEEITGQSCPYCLLSAPNIDSVTANTKSICNEIAYHVNSPGNDFMFSADSVVNDSSAWYAFFYYNAQGTPQGELDGSVSDPDLLNPAPNYTSPSVVSDVNLGSQFKISITSCTYNTTANTYNISATIKSYGAFPAGLKAKVALVIDSITYASDWNDEVAKSDFAPPIGSTSLANGGFPDNDYLYIFKYSNVVGAMLPSYSGTSLNAFTTGSSQTITLSWVKNHPWSYEGKTHTYDSSATSHMVVFLQSDSGAKAVGVISQQVLQSASASVTSFVGINELENPIAFNMYPNPTNGNTNITFDLAQEQNVSISVYNLLGEQVYTLNKGMMTAGHKTVTINGTNLAEGIYTIRLTTDNATTTEKLVIQK